MILRVIGSGLDSCFININNMFWCQEITITVFVIMLGLHQHHLYNHHHNLYPHHSLHLLNRSRNVLKTVLAYKPFSLILIKKKKKNKTERKKKGTFTINFPAGLCLVWSLFFFSFFIFWIAFSSHTSIAEQEIKKHRSTTVPHLLSLFFTQPNFTTPTRRC